MHVDAITKKTFFFFFFGAYSMCHVSLSLHVLLPP